MTRALTNPRSPAGVARGADDDGHVSAVPAQEVLIQLPHHTQRQVLGQSDNQKSLVSANHSSP